MSDWPPSPSPSHRAGWAGMPASPDAQLDVELVRQTLAAPTRMSPSPSKLVSVPQQGRSICSSSGNNGVTAQPFDVYVVLDFEATCEANLRMPDPEIIEFPMVLVDAHAAAPVAAFQRYVRPVKHPVLSQFCTKLTGITQEMVEGQDTFPMVFQEALQFLSDAGLGDAPPQRSYCVVTCGDWDLQTMLPAQLHISGPMKLPPSFQRWCNLKKCIAALAPPGDRGKPVHWEIPEMLRMVGLAHQGRLHSGIDDCRNITAILCELLKRGNRIDVTCTHTPFTRWHAPAAAELPALQELSSSVVNHQDLAASYPLLAHRRKRGAQRGPKARKREESITAPGTVSPPSTTTSAAVLPAITTDANRDAVRELLSDTRGPTPRNFSKEEQKAVSKFMSTLLRHKALQWHVPITANGYARLDNVLHQPQLASKRVTPKEVALLVRDSDKQRFRLSYGAADGCLYIAAAQGHSMSAVEPELRKVIDPDEVPTAVHGTYWEAWRAIQQCGFLSTMTRQHIHFAKGLAGDVGVVSGMRPNVQVLLYLDVAAVLADGVALLESSNGVILTPGVGDTRRLPLSYIARVVDRRTGQVLHRNTAP